MSFIRSDDATIYYEEYGTGESLILLPGLLGTIESTWRRFIPDFSHSFHTIVVDFRGHGRTNNPSGALELAMLNRDLHALIDTLALDSVMLCGYSLGGYVGLHYALQHPGRVDRLVMHATKFYWTAESTEAMQHDLDPESLERLSPQRAERLRQEHLPANGSDGWSSLARAGCSLLDEIAKRGIQEETLDLATFPVLVTQGEHDASITRVEAETLARSFPSGSFQIIPDAGHPISSVPTTVFLREVLPFLSHDAGGTD